MKATGKQIKEFYTEKWPGDDWYHDDDGSVVVWDNVHDKCNLKDSALYELKDISPLLYQGWDTTDELEFEEAFKKAMGIQGEEKNNAKCQWIYNYMTEDGIYETSCGQSFFFDSGDVKENNFKYCPFCGKEIKPIEPPLEIED